MRLEFVPDFLGGGVGGGKLACGARRTFSTKYLAENVLRMKNCPPANNLCKLNSNRRKRLLQKVSPPSPGRLTFSL